MDLKWISTIWPVFFFQRKYPYPPKFWRDHLPQTPYQELAKFLARFLFLSIFSEPANLLASSLASGPVWKTRQESLNHAIWRDHLVSKN